MQRKQPKSTESGLTLIESLAAIVIFGIAVVAVSPPIMLAMAARVRAHRAEQAMQLAQSEVDRVRVLLEKVAEADDTTVSTLTPKLPPDAVAGTAQAYGAPTGSTNQCDWGTSPATNPEQACQVDVDGDGEWDFGVQTFRTKTKTQNNRPVAFLMGVRVYMKGAFSNSTLGKQPASLAFSAANGSGSAPLAVQYQPIIVSDLKNSYSVYTELLQPDP